MITLHPKPDYIQKCPFCDSLLEVKGWHIPGMRCLADLRCPKCKKEFFGDLLVGHALYYPQLLEKDTGMVHDPYNINWLSTPFKESYQKRNSKQLEFKEEIYRQIKKPILLNCLDFLYGHSLLKLLNAQYYIDHASDHDLIVMVPDFLRWLVPDGVAAIWTIKFPLDSGTQWSDWLDKEIHNKLDMFNDVKISVAYSHPHPDFYDIQRFSRVAPFELENWYRKNKPMNITFIWREDRLWNSNSLRIKLVRKFFKLIGSSNNNNVMLGEQKKKIIRVAKNVMKIRDDIQFSIVGIGKFGEFPSWINDLRSTQINSLTERNWCELYSKSHIVIGVHGSNMLLPSAHAGSTIALMPIDRWGNVIQDFLVKQYDTRKALLLYRCLPISIHDNELVEVIHRLLINGFNEQTMSKNFTSHKLKNITNHD